MLVGLDPSSEGCGCSLAPVIDQTGLINLACSNYCVGAGALEVSVHLCLGARVLVQSWGCLEPPQGSPASPRGALVPELTPAVEEQPQSPSEPGMLNQRVMDQGDHKRYRKEGGMSGEAAEIHLKCDYFVFANDASAPLRAVGL